MIKIADLPEEVKEYISSLEERCKSNEELLSKAIITYHEQLDIIKKLKQTNKKLREKMVIMENTFK